MEDIINQLPVFYALLIAGIGYICAAVATQLDAPKDSDSGFYKVAYKVINWLGMNLKKASNADEVK